jgi:hypothetical protein
MVVAAWDLAWRVVAVRRALQNHDRKWLIPLLMVSSAGVLPIVYLFKFGSGEDAAVTTGEAPAA